MGFIPKTSSSFVEYLEARQLFAASVAALQLDADYLSAATTPALQQGGVTQTDLLGAVPAGTKGRGALSKALLKYDNDLDTAGVVIEFDAFQLTGFAAASTAQLDYAIGVFHTEVVTDRVKLKVDFNNIVAIEAKHPNLVSSSSAVIADFNTLQANWIAVKGQFKQSKLDSTLS